MARTINAKIAEYKDEGVMFILKREDGKLYEASMPIPDWHETGEVALREYDVEKPSEQA